MRRINLDREWNFHDGETVRTVNLPHDFLIEQPTDPNAVGGASTGYYGGGVGIYTKELEFNTDWEGRQVLLEFDGVYMNARVELNGQLVGRHHYGYTPFHVNLTNYIRPGHRNTLRVLADNSAQPNSRWYSGAGLYRHVDLLFSGQRFIAPWGIYARTSHITNGTAFVTVTTRVENRAGTPANLWVDTVIEDAGRTAGTGRTKVYVPAGGSAEARTLIPVKDARLWDPSDPFLYRVKCSVTDGETLLDSDSTDFGVRTISVDTINGFLLNGQSLKLRGGCIHHDNGLLGAESYYDSEYRKLKIHKDNGYNAIRCAHNPPSRDMLDACDRLGLMVIDEAFDCWRNNKNRNDYGLYFDSDWESDVEAFVLRDRNHPSVVLWSTGNEIVERGGMSEGYLLAAKLAEKVRSLDDTRPVTNALCFLWNGLEDEVQEKMQAELNGGYAENTETPFTDRIWGDYTEAFAAPLDVVGYNYLDKRYERDGARYPGRVICGTESFPNDFDHIWRHTLDHPYVIGDFTWTSFDYIGEAGIGKSFFNTTEEAPSHISAYPWRLANDADFDLCGRPRPQLGFRKAVWGLPGKEEVCLAVQDPARFGQSESVSRWGFEELKFCWTWPGFEGRNIKIVVFTCADEVELLLNGTSVGRRKAGEASRFRAEFAIPYESGVLEAVGYTQGKETCRQRLETAGEGADVAIIPEREAITADGKSLCFVNVRIVDAQGRMTPASVPLRAEVTGKAELAAFGSPDPMATENYTEGNFHSYEGFAQAILRAGTEPGMAQLKIISPFGEKICEVPVLPQREEE